MLGQLVSCSSDAKINGTVKEGKLNPNTGVNGDPKNSNQNPNDPDNTTVLSGESVSIPGAVTGAFLVCAVNELSEKVEVKVGCGFQDANSNRVAIRSIAAADKFYLTGPQPAGVTVTSLPGDELYDAYFSFTGSTFDTLKAAAFSSVYQVELTGLTNGEESKVIGGKGTTVATPPPARWLREASTDTNANTLCDGSEVCIYQGNGIMWFKDLAVAKGYGEANSFCEGFSDIFTDWRLPNESELKMAFAKGIMEVGAPNILNLSDTGYWVSSPNGTTAVNPVTGASTQVPTTEAHRSMCVRSMLVP